MKDFSILENYVSKLISKFGSNLGIEKCELRIYDYSFNSLRASPGFIQIPENYSKLIGLHAALIFRNPIFFPIQYNANLRNLCSSKVRNLGKKRKTNCKTINDN